MEVLDEKEPQEDLIQAHVHITPPYTPWDWGSGHWHGNGEGEYANWGISGWHYVTDPRNNIFWESGPCRL